jgi:hypothetical protein
VKKTLLLLTILFINILSAQAQKINESTQYHIKPATGKINIDGNLEDPAWKDTELGGDFWMITPTDTAKAKGKTEFRFTYDENFCTWPLFATNPSKTNPIS